jgi:large subunit ribosomal protein L29
MKKKDFKAEISKLSIDELKTRASTMGEELMKLRFKHATGQYEQTHRFNDIKRNLARVQTQITKQRREAQAAKAK